MVVPPALYLDECVDYPLANLLRQDGIDAVAAMEVGDRGLSDDAQLAYATRVDRVILSYNRRHFHNLHRDHIASGREHGGIILLPAASPIEQLRVRALLCLAWMTAVPERRSRLVRWGELQYRLTQGYRLPGFAERDVRLALGQRV